MGTSCACVVPGGHYDTICCGSKNDYTYWPATSAVSSALKPVKVLKAFIMKVQRLNFKVIMKVQRLNFKVIMKVQRLRLFHQHCVPPISVSGNVFNTLLLLIHSLQQLTHALYTQGAPGQTNLYGSAIPSISGKR